MFDNLGPFGARSTERHVSSKHIDDLGEFVEVKSSEPITQRSDPVVCLTGAPLDSVLFGIRAHATKLVHRKFTAVFAASLLSINPWTGARKLNDGPKDCGHHQGRNSENQSNGKLPESLPIVIWG
jgi:hypothetical protein